MSGMEQNEIKLLGQEVKTLDQEEETLKLAFRNIKHEIFELKQEEHVITKIEKMINKLKIESKKIITDFMNVLANKTRPEIIQNRIRALMADFKDFQSRYLEFRDMSNEYARLLKMDEEAERKNLNIYTIIKEEYAKLNNEIENMTSSMFGRSEIFNHSKEELYEAFRNQQNKKI